MVLVRSSDVYLELSDEDVDFIDEFISNLINHWSHGKISKLEMFEHNDKMVMKIHWYDDKPGRV